MQIYKTTNKQNHMLLTVIYYKETKFQVLTSWFSNCTEMNENSAYLKYMDVQNVSQITHQYKTSLHMNKNVEKGPKTEVSKWNFIYLLYIDTEAVLYVWGLNCASVFIYFFICLVKFVHIVSA